MNRHRFVSGRRSWVGVRACATVLVLLASFSAAGEESLMDGAKQVGRAVGSAVRDVGHGAKQVGKEIGHTARDAGKAVGQAAQEGGREFRRAVKGE